MLKANLSADADGEQTPTPKPTAGGPVPRYSARFVDGKKYQNEFEDPFDVDDIVSPQDEELKTPTPGPDDADEESKESREKEEAILQLMMEKDKVYQDLK